MPFLLALLFVLISTISFSNSDTTVRVFGDSAIRLYFGLSEVKEDAVPGFDRVFQKIGSSIVCYKSIEYWDKSEGWISRAKPTPEEISCRLSLGSRGSAIASHEPYSRCDDHPVSNCLHDCTQNEAEATDCAPSHIFQPLCRINSTNVLICHRGRTYFDENKAHPCCEK